MASRELPAQQSARPATSQRVGGNYDVLEELGRGGMAVVYRVLDARSGKILALKQLLPQRDDKHTRESELLFEREYHTLAQLAHPRVIEVYDYGVDGGVPYYTMELLDGGDLRERSPLPWREACELIFDVCSSLALLHSRRLVHRDVSPRNVRCTHDRHAKLIDFGAMVPMGTNAQVVGTPPFVAPEAVHGSTLDARTDLFSLGATLYFALTGRLAYPARSFAQLVESWSTKPAPPSAVAADVPPALDGLVMSLISLEAAPRPRSAFEVMQRLAAVAGIHREEPLSVSKAYLVTPSLIARDEPLASFREVLGRARHGRGRGLLIAAPAGMGRSRMLDACALEAKLVGCCVLRVAAASCEDQELAAAHALAEQLLNEAPEAALDAARTAGVFELLFEPSPAANDALPKLQSFERSAEQRGALASALAKWFVQVSKRTYLLIAADDVDRLDDASVALLATLAQRARTHGLVVLASAEEAGGGVSLPARLEVLSSRCGLLPLRALNLPETEQLLGSLFGDVPNLALLSARIHALAAGNPRQVMALAQYLVDRGSISYDGGSWSLPQQLTAANMPASAQAAVRARISQCSPLARRLVEAHALGQEQTLTREDYALLEPEASAESLELALSELSTQQLLRGDGAGYMLENHSLREVLCDGLSEDARRERYAALARHNQQSARHAFTTARYFLLAGEHARGLDLLVTFVRSVRDRVEFVAASRLSPDEAAHTLDVALSAAQTLGRRERDRADIRYWLTMISVGTDERYYWIGAPAWRAQLERDSGLADYWRLSEIADSGQRLMRALTDTTARYAATPEAERVYSAEEAIRLLVHYVVLSIAIGARTFDGELIKSLPELLEPFAGLSPLLAAIWQNALATQESGALRQPERARARWLEVYERLGKVDSQDPQIVSSIRYAIAFGIGLTDASFGVAIDQWAELLDRDPMQRVNSMYLRKIAHLQQGDLEGAERCRKQAELLALQASTRQMFNSLVSLEVTVHAAAWDLTGVKQAAARIEPLAAQHPGWVPFRHLAEGHYRRLVGDLDAAAAAYQRCLALSTPDPSDPKRSTSAWPTAAGAYVETLIALGRNREARELGSASLRECERLEIRMASHDIVRALALAEAKCGEHTAGAARLEQLIQQQRELGVTGLNLGATYEARARVAIWAGDPAAVERFGKLTADQYRHGRGSTLGARYERLMEEARGAGVLVLPELSPFETTIFGGTEMGTRVNATLAVVSAMTGAHDSHVRAQRALRLLCDSRGARGGHLYLADSSELRLAASSGNAPDDMLQRLVSDFWSQLADDTDPDTEMLSEGQQVTQVWTDRDGMSYWPVLLSGKLNGLPMIAGVALLAGEPRQENTEVDVPLTTELATFLLRTGDSIRPQY